MATKKKSSDPKIKKPIQDSAFEINLDALDAGEIDLSEVLKLLETESGEQSATQK